jgi:hypothetical protein
VSPDMLLRYSTSVQPSEYLRHPDSADAQVSGDGGPVLELAGIKKLIRADKFQRITVLLRVGGATQIRLRSPTGT